jgi:hypothetical protein
VLSQDAKEKRRGKLETEEAQIINNLITTMEDGSEVHEMTSEQDGPQVATPDRDDREEVAVAAAEISVIERSDDQRQASMNDNAMEMVDESGELVQQAFLQFLQD